MNIIWTQPYNHSIIDPPEQLTLFEIRVNWFVWAKQLILTVINIIYHVYWHTNWNKSEILTIHFNHFTSRISWMKQFLWQTLKFYKKLHRETLTERLEFLSESQSLSWSWLLVRPVVVVVGVGRGHNSTNSSSVLALRLKFHRTQKSLDETTMGTDIRKKKDVHTL